MGSTQPYGGDLDSTQDGGVTVQTSQSRVRLVRFLLDVTQVGDLIDILDDDPGFPEATPHTPSWPQV